MQDGQKSLLLMLLAITVVGVQFAQAMEQKKPRKESKKREKIRSNPQGMVPGGVPTPAVDAIQEGDIRELFALYIKASFAGIRPIEEKFNTMLAVIPDPDKPQLVQEWKQVKHERHQKLLRAQNLIAQELAADMNARTSPLSKNEQDDLRKAAQEQWANAGRELQEPHSRCSCCGVCCCGSR